MLRRFELRSRMITAHKRHKFVLKSEKNDIKPLYTVNSSYSALQSRSPLMALLFPTYKDRLVLSEEYIYIYIYRQSGFGNKSPGGKGQGLNKSMVSNIRNVRQIVNREYKRRGSFTHEANLE